MHVTFSVTRVHNVPVPYDSLSVPQLSLCIIHSMRIWSTSSMPDLVPGSSKKPKSTVAGESQTLANDYTTNNTYRGETMKKQG